MNRLLIIILVSIFLWSCGKKYEAQFYKEGIPWSFSTSGIPTIKTFRAKNDADAYKKAGEMIMDLEEKNEDKNSAYKKFYVFVAKTKKYIRLSSEIKKEIEGELGYEYFLEKSRSEKRSAIYKVQDKNQRKTYQEIQSDIKSLVNKKQ